MRASLLSALGGLALGALAFAGPALAQGPVEAAPATGRGAEMVRQRLAAYDLNGDGGFDSSEIAEMRAASFQRLDTNADGFITADEREAQAQKRSRFAGRFGSGGGLDQAAGSRLDALDIDGDGAISQAEHANHIPAWVERLDADLDGVVSADEMAVAREMIGARHQTQ